MSFFKFFKINFSSEQEFENDDRPLKRVATENPKISRIYKPQLRIEEKYLVQERYDEELKCKKCNCIMLEPETLGCGHNICKSHIKNLKKGNKRK
jgi:hypothetical protein